MVEMIRIAPWPAGMSAPAKKIRRFGRFDGPAFVMRFKHAHFTMNLDSLNSPQPVGGTARCKGIVVAGDKSDSGGGFKACRVVPFWMLPC